MIALAAPPLRAVVGHRVRLMKPRWEAVMTQPSLGITSSIRNSPAAAMISVRRGEAYFAFISRSSFLISARSFASDSRMPLQLLDQLQELEVLGLDLAALQAGQLVEAQLQDRVGLPLRKGILRHQAHLGLVAVRRSPDDLHEVVEVIERDDVALEDVGPVLGLAQAEARAARDDIAAVLDVALDQLLDVHLLRPLAVEGEKRDAERGLEGGLLEKLVDDDLGLLAALELDDDPRVLVGFVAKVADAVESPSPRPARRCASPGSRGSRCRGSR